ncbi:uncharacterized protein HMPREF1541_03984 [Cyphellophora europaea CBS 101466]|uniref:Zn(2)-C6 fungal-type domain-containing protein n=1 Tax=Cyphellophora europaea (strain CBS 101466) TaxID=1220924 RepID=W2S0C1_CYPE1|nr:uncharacterized protein HMPREF1541_03984 [Cyphellophora europaea CBS 101466]ETN42045.1 hypothetical protein HMPREF1541_03984 [Cyphellophora europaea CBS 101466]
MADIVISCEACKQRKVKCDRVQPACGWCARNDHLCEYKERKKPGLRAGYGRELESRLDSLERQLQEQTRQLAAHLADACNTNGALNTRPGHPSYDATLQQHTLDPNLRPPSRQDPYPFLPTASEPRDPNDHKLRPLSRQNSFHFSAAPPEPQNIQSQNQYTPSAQSYPLTSPHSASGYQEQAAYLPPYDLLYALVDLFFKHINAWLPLLERKTTLDRLFGAAPLDEADRVLLHAMVAVTLRFSRDPRLTPESRQQYHAVSKQRVQLFGLENSSVRSLQALTILALDVTGDTNGPPGWNLISLISRSVIQLGLAVEATSTLTASMFPSISTLRAAVLPEAKTWIEDEERRRLFWAVYLLDRYTTVATAFDFALDDKEIDRRLPCRDDLFSANKPVETRPFKPTQRPKYAANVSDAHGHFSYFIEILGILSSIHKFLKRPIDIGSLTDVEQWQGTYRALDSELHAWHFSLPDDFANIIRLMKSNVPAKHAHCGWITVHAAYCLTVIRLNSSAAYPSQTSPIFSSSYSAMQRCLSAVESLRQLVHFVQISGLTDKLGPPVAFCVWVCARVTLVHGSTIDHDVDPDIGFFVSILSEMGANWDVARRYSEILNRVLSEYQHSRSAVRLTGERTTPSTVRILADMRRCAYDLDFLISRQPHNSIKSYHPTRANTPQPNELEYLDVFDLFNFPRLATAGADGLENGNQAQVLDQAAGASDLATMIPNFAVPDPQEDWLFHPR